MKATWNRITQYLLSLAVFIALISQSDLAGFAWVNLVVQLVIFIGLACIPAYFTNRMSYVDAAWPSGLVAIGVLTLIFGGITSPLTVAIATIYVLIGGRMAIWGLSLVLSGELTEELPRYRYQRIRWERAGLRSERLSIQVEIMMQGTANMSFLAVPAIVSTGNSSQSFGIFAAVGLAVWILSYVLESVADTQKKRFGAECARAGVRGRTCDIGLWRYSRHPNYFGQWMQWNALIVMVAPTLVSRWGHVAPTAWIITLAGLLLASFAMYQTLVAYTGAKPAEFYSLQKRPEYANYQRTTNMFFPGPQRKASPSRSR